ncbi:MAG: PAS domain-containing protein [Anaerolineae bacterium]|nr:PAS domain-containing protein [Anaerolineae bacterium]
MNDASLEQVHQYLFERIADGVLVIDAEGIIEALNPAATAMLGVTGEQAREKRASTLFRNNASLLNLLNRPGEQVLDVHLPRRRLALGITSTLDGGGRLIILQDVTEQRKLDMHRQELIQRMAHDLRNPLMAMSGFAELIETMGELSPQQQHFVTRLRQTTSKLYDVAAELVDLVWIEAGLPLQHRPLRLQEQIAQAITSLSALAEEQHVVIAFSVQDPLPLVIGDPDRLCMALSQLLKNAILYSEPESTVAIHAWGDGFDLYCSVADKGIGISDNELYLVFDRLYRSNDSRVQAIPGGGLGLTLAKKIILRHGGDIWAASNLGKGSTFTFVLPAISA